MTFSLVPLAMIVSLRDVCHIAGALFPDVPPRGVHACARVCARESVCKHMQIGQTSTTGIRCPTVFPFADKLTTSCTGGVRPKDTYMLHSGVFSFKVCRFEHEHVRRQYCYQRECTGTSRRCYSIPGKVPTHSCYMTHPKTEYL